MTNKSIERTCERCGAKWINRGKSHRTRYCSPACRTAALYACNRSNRGVVPVGKTFLRSHDGAVCVVCQDARGLPYAEAKRELAQVQQEAGQCDVVSFW